MNVNISFQQKDAAKAAFRAAGLPLTWNADKKVWQTSASSLPASLAHYASAAAPSKPSSGGQVFYLAQRDCAAKGFDFYVEAVFSDAQALIDHVVSGRWLAPFAGSERAIFASSIYVVTSHARIGCGKHLPNQSVIGYNRLVEAKNAAVRNAALAAAQ